MSAWNDEELAMRARLEAGDTVVVNMSKDGQPRLWAWAKSQGMAQRIDRFTRWGNPYKMRNASMEERRRVIDEYVTHWQARTALHEDIATLQGVALGCWCAPLPCHGDHLAALANDRERAG